MKAVTRIEQSLAAALAMGEDPGCPPKLAGSLTALYRSPYKSAAAIIRRARRSPKALPGHTVCIGLAPELHKTK